MLKLFSRFAHATRKQCDKELFVPENFNFFSNYFSVPDYNLCNDKKLNSNCEDKTADSSNELNNNETFEDKNVALQMVVDLITDFEHNLDTQAEAKNQSRSDSFMLRHVGKSLR